MIRQKKIAIAIFIFYLVLIVPGAFLSYKFFQNTKMVYKAPSGSVVDKAQERAARDFTTQILNNPLLQLYVMEDRSKSIIDDKNFRNYSMAIIEDAKPGGSLHPIVEAMEAYYAIPASIPEARNKLVGGANNDTTLITFSVPKDVKMMDAVKTMNTYYAHWVEKHGKTFEMDTTSVNQVTSDLTAGILSDLGHIDLISMPLAFACLAYCVGSIRMLVIPGLTVVSTIVITFAIMYPVSLATNISAFAPEMTAGVISSISIDYALFILTRFLDRVELNEASHGLSEETQWRVVYETTLLSSHNIVVSGLTIAAALGALSFLPINFISTTGIGFFVGAIVAVVVALTLMPSVLFIFYNFFKVRETCEGPRRLWGRIRGKPEESEEQLLAKDDGELTLAEVENARREEQQKSIWFKIGRLTTTRPLLIILLVVVVAVPFIYFATELKTDFDLFNQVPRDSPHAKILKRITEEIGHGSTTPFYVTFTAKEVNGTVCSNAVFALVNMVTEGIASRAGQPLDRIMSFAYVPGEGALSWTNASIALLFSKQYQYLFKQTVNADRTAGLIALYTDFDPFHAEANAYLNHVNDAIEEYADNGMVDIGLLGASAVSWSIMKRVMQLFPVLIGSTFAVIFVFIAVWFRSVFIPFRMVFTVAYTVAVAYGVGVLVFQYDFTHTLWTAMEGVVSYSWTVPIFSFSLLCALTLDYDVFLLTRIIEYKKIGYTNEAAVTKAVHKTGRIISFAGIVMFWVFGSMMFSNVTMLNQFGCIAAFAVIVDTFVVRPFFVPALMSIFPNAAFWPRKFPELGLDIDCMKEHEEEIDFSSENAASVQRDDYSLPALGQKYV